MVIFHVARRYKRHPSCSTNFAHRYRDLLGHYLETARITTLAPLCDVQLRGHKVQKRSCPLYCMVVDTELHILSFSLPCCLATTNGHAPKLSKYLLVSRSAIDRTIGGSVLDG